MRPVVNTDQDKRRVTITLPKDAAKDLKLRAVEKDMTIGEYLIKELNLENNKEN